MGFPLNLYKTTMALNKLIAAIAITCVFLINPTLTHAQLSWDWAFAEQSSGYASGLDLAVDKFGNMYATGFFSGTSTFDDTTLTSSGTYNGFLVKYDSLGNRVWAKQFGTGASFGSGLVLDTSMNVYLTGRLENTTILRKYNTAGTQLWSNTIPGPTYNFYDKPHPISIVNNTICVATTSSHRAYSTTGSYIGGGSLAATSISSVGKSSFLLANNTHLRFVNSNLNLGPVYFVPDSISTVNHAVNKNGFIYLTGMLDGTAVFGSDTLSGYRDIFIAKLDSSTGNFVWATQGYGTTSADEGYSIVLGDSNEVYLAGNFRNFGTFDTVTLCSGWCKSRLFIARMNGNNGHVIELISAGGIDDGDKAYAMLMTKDKQLMVTGSLFDFAGLGADFGSFKVFSNTGNIDFFIAKTRLSEITSMIKGRITKNLSPAYALVELYRKNPDSTVSLISSQYSQPNGTYEFDVYDKGKYFVKAFYNQPNHVSTYYTRTYNWEKATELSIDDTIMAGIDIRLVNTPINSGTHSLSGTVYDIDSLPVRFITMLLVDHSDSLIAVTYTDTLGDYTFQNLSSGSYKILLDTAGVYLDSYYTVKISAKKALKVYSGYDYYLKGGVAYPVSPGISIDEISLSQLEIYPLPADALLHIRLNPQYSNAEISLLDSRGSVCYQSKSGANTIDVSGLQSGLYIVRVQSHEGVVHKRILISH